MTAKVNSSKKKNGASNMNKKYTLAMLVRDIPGIMARVTGLFTRRGFNIDTITVGKTEKKGISRIVITLQGDEKIVEQIKKQLNKLIDVLKISELSQDDSIMQEMCMIKIATNTKNKEAILKYAELMKANVLDIENSKIILRYAGTQQEVNSFIKGLDGMPIKAISRTGINAIMKN